MTLKNLKITRLFSLIMVSGALALEAQAQNYIQNVVAEQQGKNIVITYNLLAANSSHKFEVNLYCSTDGGSTWSAPLTALTGDVGKTVTPGNNKTIVWNVLAERTRLQGDNIVFELRAKPANANYTETYASLNMDMVFVKGGSFMMGSPAGETDSENDEKPQHRVSVDAFYMGKHEVTFEQYDIFCNATGRSKPSDEGWGRGKRPVINVSWNDATAFCEWLSQKTDKTYRLPTEAEWEYACRAGTTTPFNTGNCLSTSQANYDGNYPYNGCSNGNYEQKTKAVGSYAANAWGLHDMHGNVWEWCSDWYGAYSTSAQTNPEGPVSGSYRVNRGGSWYYYARNCRSAIRYYDSPGDTTGYLGFRVVCVP